MLGHKVSFNNFFYHESNAIHFQFSPPLTLPILAFRGMQLRLAK